MAGNLIRTGFLIATSFALAPPATAETRTATIAMRKSGESTIQVTTLAPEHFDVERIADELEATMNTLLAPPSRHNFALDVVERHVDDGGFSIDASPTRAVASIPTRRDDADWMPFVIEAAVMPLNESVDPATAWYTQGVTAFRALVLLREAGEISPPSLTYLLNRATTEYGNSPVRRASNQRVVAEYATIAQLRELPVLRGALFAMLLDARIRAATGGARSLEDALRTMPSDASDPGPALVDAVANAGGGDIAPLYQRYIVDGVLLQLPHDALGPCFTIGTVADWSGWQVQHVFAKPSCPGLIP